MGVDVASAIHQMVSLGVDAVGFNCGTVSLEDYVKLADKYVSAVKALDKEVLIYAEPNAGSPQLVEDRAVYNVLPDKFAAAAEKIHSAGVNIIGGCCGTSPEHIEAIAKKLKISRKKAAMICQGIMAVSAPTQMANDEPQTLAEMLADDSANPAMLFEDEGNTAIVRKLLAKLPERQQKILTYRFGLDGHKGPQRTFKEVGKLVGLTRERARQLEKESLARLQVLIDEMW